MDQRVPPSLQPLLDDYLSRLRRGLPGLLTGCYVHGSVALGAYVDGASDVDALVLTSRRCTGEDIAALDALHRKVAVAWPRTRLEASYVAFEDRGLRGAAAPPHPFYDGSRFHASDAADPNSPFRSAIGWWQVARKSIVLAGPEPAALDLAVTSAELVADSVALLDTHWHEWTRSPRLVASLRHAKSRDWAVLGILRTYYTLREQDVTTKARASNYGVAHLPSRWHRLIMETRAVRSGRPAPRRLGSALDAALFMRFMVAECRRQSLRSSRS